MARRSACDRGRSGLALRGEDGSGPVTAGVSLFMFLLFVLLGVQVTLHLFATTQASALALEAASRVARGEVDCAGAEAWVAQRIPGWHGVAGHCSSDDDRVRMSLRGPSPAPSLRAFGRLTGFDTLVRTADVRIERFR